MPRVLPPEPSSSPGPCIPVPTAFQPGPSKTTTTGKPLIAVDTAGLWNPPTHPLPCSRAPNSRVLISATKPGDPTPTKNNISLRYQPMTIVDPTSHTTPAPPVRKQKLDSPMTSSRHISPSSRGFRPKPCPGPRNMLEAIPNSWASASRPSDLRPNPPAPQASKGSSRPSPTPPPPPPPARPNTVRLRSKSAERVGTKTSVSGPRSPRRGAVVQPTPKRLSLGMVMDTAKLVSTPPASDLGSSISAPLSKSIVHPAATNAVPIRSIPSPNGSPCIARLPISGSHYKRELSPSPVSPVHRSTSPLSPPALGPRVLPVPPSASLPPSNSPPIPPSLHRPILLLNPIVPLSPFTPSAPSLPSLSSKSPLSNVSATPTTATTTTTGTASSYISALSSDSSKYDEGLHVKRDKSNDSPAFVWSSGHFASPSSLQNDRGRDDHQDPQVQDTHTLDKLISSTQTTVLSYSSPSPVIPPSLPIEKEEEDEEEERLDRLDNLDAYDWTLEEEQYDDQLFRIPISPTSPTSSSGHLLNGSDDPTLEVFVDNLYCGDVERSPSPITYARPAGSDYSDEESNVGRRRRARRRPNVDLKEERKSPQLTGDTYLDVNGSIPSPTSPTGNQRHNRQSNNYPSSPISYHSDDSSLYFTGTRPLPSRRRREQLRSYRYSFRPPVSPTSAAAALAVSSNTLAAFSPKLVRGGGGGGGGGADLAKVLGCQRSPSPIAYARRRSLDGLSDLDSEDEMDDGGDGDVSGGVFTRQQEGGGGDGGKEGLVSGWWESRDTNALGFFLADGRRRGGGGKKRRFVQPRSFMHAYSKPPDVTSFEAHSEERERVLEREKERGRKKERALIPMPLVNYNNNDGNSNNNNNNKERSKDKDTKEKPRTRKGSRGLLDELAAVAARNNNSTRKSNNNTTPRTSGGSPPPSLPSLPSLPFQSKERDRDEKDNKEKEKEKEKKRKWVWELNKSDSSSKDKLVCNADGSSLTSAGSSGENVLVLDIGGGMNSGGGGGDKRRGYEGWDAEWSDEDLVGGGNWRGKKHRHSLNGLEFV